MNIKKIIELNLKSIIEFKGDFILSAFVMLINNILLFFTYIYIAKKVFSVDYKFVITGFAILMFAYCLIGFSRGLLDLPELIVKGDLDLFLTKPKSLLLKLLFYEINPFIIGELVTFLLLFVLSDKKTFFLFLIPSTILYISTTLFLNSIQFFVRSNYPMSCLYAFWDTLWIPLHKYEILKIISFYILPGNLVTFSIYYINKGVISWEIYLLVVIVFLILAITTYKIGLRKYESVGY